MERKIELLHKTISKFSEYYDNNNLKHHQVIQIVQQVKEIEKSLEGKANSIDVKKLVPRIRNNNLLLIFL